MSGKIQHHTKNSVLSLHDTVLRAHGGLAGVRSHELLESAIAAPQASFQGEFIFSDPIEIGAAYLFYLCANHPFNDDNKRTALASCLVFLITNKVLSADIVLDTDAWEAFVLDVAASKIDRDAATERLRELIAE